MTGRIGFCRLLLILFTLAKHSTAGRYCVGFPGASLFLTAFEREYTTRQSRAGPSKGTTSTQNHATSPIERPA